MGEKRISDLKTYDDYIRYLWKLQLRQMYDLEFITQESYDNAVQFELKSMQVFEKVLIDLTPHHELLKKCLAKVKKTPKIDEVGRLTTIKTLFTDVIPKLPPSEFDDQWDALLNEVEVGLKTPEIQSSEPLLDVLKSLEKSLGVFAKLNASMKKSEEVNK